MTTYTPRWVLRQEGRNPFCCHQCGKLVKSAWLYFGRPAVYTIVWCEPCAEDNLAKQVDEDRAA